MERNTAIADQNTERLIHAAHQPDAVPAEFAAKLEATLKQAMRSMPTRQTAPPPAPQNRLRHAALVVGSLAACALFVLVFSALQRSQPTKAKVQLAKEFDKPQTPATQRANWGNDVRDAMTPRQRPTPPGLAVLQVGETIATRAGQRRLVQLPDGTKLYVNEKSEVHATGSRKLTLRTGEVYFEVAPNDDSRFVVKAPQREFTATGTHFAVQADAKAPGLIVTQGKVAVQGIDPDVTAGKRIVPGSSEIVNAARASHLLEWTRELMAAAETPMVPGCEHAGGALLALDPQGQEIKLSLRKYHIDVHIEDGFARTTIDQTYFNTTWERLEGTFHFPLPPDASLSRLAMYVVDGNNQFKLMEGGMAERQHAANVYETIRYQRRDPALLEWLDGSTFKMRVFPLEAKQEKRIILSYTQKLPEQSGIARYCFAGGHNLPIVREWSFSARIKNGHALNVRCPSHGDMIAQPDVGGDLIVTNHAKGIKPTADVVLELQEREVNVDRELPRFSSFQHENHTYLMLRYRPTLKTLHERQRRDWIILFEASASRDPLLAGTQVEILRHLLKNAEYDDTFTLLTANSRVRIFNDKPLPVRPPQIDEAVKFLQQTHLVGALDLQQGLDAALKIAKDAKNPHLLHLGSGTPAMGERDAGKLAALLPASVRYVGVGVGKRWNRAFMKQAAERTGGLFVQINPDEVLAWRAFDLLSTLNTPRLLDVQVCDGNEKLRLLTETTMIAQGEEICTITRVDGAQAVPGNVIVKANVSQVGQALQPDRLRAFTRTFPVINVQPGAGYLPRLWAKLEIDRLLADGAAKNKDAIVALSKAMYVMSPYTSLLVLETDADYERFKVDRGRKDHWAMYSAPAKIPQVYEPDGAAPAKAEAKKPADAKPNVDAVLRTMMWPINFARYEGPGTLNEQTDAIRVLALNPAMANDFKDVLVRVGETRTGSLMLGAGINSDRGVVGNINVNTIMDPLVFEELADRKARKRPEFGPPALANIPYLSKLFRNAGWSRDQANSPEAERIMRRQRLFNEDTDEFERLKKFDLNADWRLTDSRVPLDRGRGERGNQAYELSEEIRENKRMLGTQRRYDARVFFTDPAYLSAAKKKIDSADATERILGITFLPAPVPVGGVVPDLNISIGSNSFNYITRASDSFRYERPAFEYDATLFTNLVQYAPGLHNSRADILATLEREADVEPTPLGKIDADARKLIEKARSAEWFALTVPAQGPLPSYLIYYNGVGQFAYERLLASGLTEQVICDGQTLWHLYREIGLSAKRPMSRHHQQLISSFAPAFLPTPEELARGHEVKAIDAATVALIPLGTDKHRVHLVFAKDGTLSERRLVAMPKGEIVARQVSSKDGVEWRDATDKVIAKETRVVALAKAPSLQPKTSDLVVMQMPIRTVAHIIDNARKLGRDPETHSEAVLDQLVAYCLGGGGNDKWVFPLARRLAENKDRRHGIVTLLNAGAVANVPLTGLDLQADASALGQYLSQCQRLLPNDAQEPFKPLPGLKDGFVQGLARFRNLWLAWHNQTVSRDAAGLPLEKAKVLEFLQDTPSPLFAYALLDTMQRRANTAPTEQMLGIAAKRFGPISDPLGLGYVFRYEHARSLYQTGNGVEAGRAFRKLHAGTLSLGVMPPIDAGFREVLQMPIGDGPKFVGFTRKTLDDLLSKKHFGLAFQLAKQMEQLGDDALSDEILATILVRADDKERDGLTFASIEYQVQRQDFAQADRLVQRLLEDKKLANAPELWHWRSELTKRIGQPAASVACLEKALELEYADLPELIDLERLRGEYRTLLGHYQTLAESLATLRTPAPKEFLAKVIRSADRWRLLDGESAEPCMMAGKIFHTLGLGDLAWDYWTAPIDRQPAESKPWLDLAETLKSAGEWGRADRAFELAFEAEPTNPEILWKRAQNLVRQGQGERARELYRRIAAGPWQERFSATVEQARSLTTP